MQHTVTDHELITRYNSGDQAAFAEIVERYTRQIRYHMRKIAWHVDPTDMEDALDDLMQEVWLRVARAACRVDSTYKFSSWLYTIATNVARNSQRNARRRHEQRMPYTRDEYGAEIALDTEYADPHSCSQPDVLCEQRDLLERVLADLTSTITPSHLETFTLREVDGLSYEEIAIRLGVQLGTVKSRIHRVHNHTRAFRARYGGN